MQIISPQELFLVKFNFPRDDRLPKSADMVTSDNPQSRRCSFLSELKPEKEAGRNTLEFDLLGESHNEKK